MFNLIDEPWIIAQTEDGTQELSLRDVFREAESIQRLGGEVPTQTFAILRVMLAICHHAIGWHSRKDLAHLRRHGLDLSAIDAYLDEWHDRFDLFDPERPFMQVAGLRTGKNEHSGLEKLIADVPNGAPFFTTRAGHGLERISPAEAARWVVHVQAFDPSGIRSGAVGDDNVKGGKGYPIGPGWSGQLGGVVLHGTNLADTLRFNLTDTPNDPADVPVWALDEPHTAKRAADPVMPVGPVQLLVWQSRRIRLVGDRSGVHGVVLAQGDRIAPQNKAELEAMTGWRYSKPQTKKLGRTVYMPNKHEPERSMWRGLPALVAAGHEKVEDHGSHDRYKAPATIENLERFEDDDSDVGFVTLQTIGISYGAQEATIDEIVDDELALHASLLSEEAAPIRAMLDDEVRNADECVRTLGQLAANLARAVGEKGDGAGDGARQRAMEQGWAELDPVARRWVGTLQAESDLLAVKREWQTEVERVVLRVERQVLDAAGPAAMRGRETNFGFLSTPIAHQRFMRQIRKTLTVIHPSKETTA